MKLKTKNNAAKKSGNINKNKSPNKQAKGVEVRKEKSKVVVKPTVLKKEAAKTKVEEPSSPLKALQQELWNNALVNVSNMSDLSDEESSIVKLLANYTKKSSVPKKSIKLKNFIKKGFSKYKDTSDDVLDGIYTKIFTEFKALGGNAEKEVKSKKSDPKAVKTNPKKEVSNDEENGDDDDDNDEVDDDDDEVDDEAEGIMFGDSNDDIDDDEDESEEEPKTKGNKANKANNKNGKSQPIKGNNGSKFKGGKIQKNKKFGKKK